MIPTDTRDPTHIFKKPENWNDETEGPCGDLKVRAECFGEREIVELISTWKPTAHELAHLNRGGVIEIGLCQKTQPPMRAYVVDPVGGIPAESDQATLDNISGHPLDDVRVEECVRHPDKVITINEEAHGHG